MLEPILTLNRTRLDASLRWHDRDENFALTPFFNSPFRVKSNPKLFNNLWRDQNNQIRRLFASC